MPDLLGHILIIDDSDANRYLLKKMLQRGGYDSTEAKTSQEGLEKAKDKPSLIILDVELPDGNGFEICVKLKANPLTKTIPILMTSASFVKAEDKLLGIDSGADGYLTTPIDSLELIASVKALIRIRETERALRTVQENLRLMIESVKDYAIFSMDAEGFISSWNSGAERIFGYNEVEILGQPVNILFTPEDRLNNIPEKEMNTAAATGRASDERWHLAKGDRRFFASGVMTRVDDQAGNVRGFTKIARDVTEQKEIQEKLRKSEERFDLALKGMNDGLWDYNVVTGEIYFSPRCKEMLGYNKNEKINTADDWISHINPEERDAATKRMSNYLKGEIPEYKNVFRARHRDGSWRWLLSRGQAVYNAEGKAVRMVGVHTDITEQKELEQELRQAYEKAETANNAKTEFLTNMSHEIRTPMNAVIGLANILSRSDPLTDKQKQFITTLQLSAEALLSLINDMLDIAKIEDNMIELEYVSFNLRELIGNITNILSVKANEKGLLLEIDYQKNLSQSFIGDPLRIQQVLVNLINNAIKFTAQGKIKIKVESKPLPEKKQEISIKIIDTGIGISQEKLHTIFEKFTQGDASITRKYGGSGLGLTISKALVERMAGNIHVASETGKGSVFTIALPLQVCLEPSSTILKQETTISSEAEAPKKKHILLVEDYKANILVATTFLGEFGYSYDTALSGPEALEKIALNHFDAILMDIQMHGMDGFETTRHVRVFETAQNLKRTPIIAMTAHALADDRERCLEADMDDYISKPFNPAELKEKLASILAPESTLS